MNPKYKGVITFGSGATKEDYYYTGIKENTDGSFTLSGLTPKV